MNRRNSTRRNTKVGSHEIEEEEDQEENSVDSSTDDSEYVINRNKKNTKKNFQKGDKRKSTQQYTQKRIENQRNESRNKETINEIRKGQSKVVHTNKRASSTYSSVQEETEPSLSDSEYDVNVFNDLNEEEEDEEESESSVDKRRRKKQNKTNRKSTMLRRNSSTLAVIHSKKSTEERNTKNVKGGGIKTNTFIDKLNEDIDDDDFDIFKKNKYIRNKRVSIQGRLLGLKETILKKKEMQNMDVSNSETGDRSDGESILSEPATQVPKNNKNLLDKSKNTRNEKHREPVEDLYLYDKIKKNPKNLQEVIEDIYYMIFKKMPSYTLKLLTWILNFIAQCSGAEALTWTLDIIDYIDKQLYTYESIENINSIVTAYSDITGLENGNQREHTNNNEITNPSNIERGKVTNLKEIIKDEYTFEKVCHFKCEKLEQYLTTGTESSDVLIKKKNENNKSYKAFSEFFANLSYHFDENCIEEILYLCAWIISLSVSKYRKIRFTASVASSALLMGLCRKINFINIHEKQSRKQLLSEFLREEKKQTQGHHMEQTSNKQRNDVDVEEIINYKKNGNSEEIIGIIVERNLIIQQLIDNIQEDRKNLTILNNFLISTYNVLYTNKIRDVFPDIRLVTLEYFYKYLGIITTYFTNRKFTKHLLWILFDKDSKIKIAVLDILTYLSNYYNQHVHNHKNLKIVEVLFLAKRRLLNLIFDVDYNVRLKTFELILEMSKMQVQRSSLIDIKGKKKLNQFLNKDKNKTNEHSDSNEETDSGISAYEPVDTPLSDSNENISMLRKGETKQFKKNKEGTYVSIISKSEKEIITGLIWFNNNDKISKIITCLIYESDLKRNMKKIEKNKKSYTEVDKNDINNEIIKYNIIFVSKFLCNIIPNVKNFIHYFDYLTKYNENLKLYTVIDKFITGIREKFESVNYIDVILQILCEENIATLESLESQTEELNKTDSRRQKSRKSIMDRNRNEENEETEKEQNQGNHHLKKKKSRKSTREESEEEEDQATERDLRKCLLHICESSYRNLVEDIDELERNKNKKNTQGSNPNDKNVQSSKVNSDTNKIKKMIVYTFHIIKTSKQLIKLHQTNQEHLLLVYKIIKMALHECKRIYKNGQKSSIYNFSSSIIEYFKNDIDSSLNFFFNNVTIHMKETYEYLFYLLMNFKLPYYSAKYTMNVIALFLSFREILTQSDIFSTDIFFDSYHEFFQNVVVGFNHYKRNCVTEIEQHSEDEEENNEEEEEEEECGYLRTSKQGAAIIKENIIAKGKSFAESMESEININLTMLIHFYTLCFNLIHNDLTSYMKKNKISTEQSVSRIVQRNYFQLMQDEEYTSFIKNNAYLNDLFVESCTIWYDKDIRQDSDHEHSEEESKEKRKKTKTYTKEKNGEEVNEEDEDTKEESEEEEQEEDQEEDQSDAIRESGDEEEGIKKRRNQKKKHTKIPQIKTKKKKKNKNNKEDTSKDIEEEDEEENAYKRVRNRLNKSENTQYKLHNIHNLYYCPDSCTHANVLIQICMFLVKTKINSIKHHDEDNMPYTPTSKLTLLCIDQIFILYENYIYHLCRKKYFFNYLVDSLLKSNEESNEKEDASGEKRNEEGTKNNNEDKNEQEEEHRKKEEEEEEEEEERYGVNPKHIKKLNQLSSKKVTILKNLFIELNQLYQNIILLRNDFNELQIKLIRMSPQVILNYSVFLSLMNVAQLDNVLLFSNEEFKKYQTVEYFLNKYDKENVSDGITNHISDYLDVNDKLNKYKCVIRYAFKDKNELFNFVSDMFKCVENINNENMNFVNSFLSIDVSTFFPINTYTYIADMCKIYNKDELSEDSNIKEMQYLHMTLVIGHFILNCNNINIFNSSLGVLLLSLLTAKNKGLFSIALNFHNKLKKYNIDIFYEVLLCGLIGLHTAYTNNAMEEKDLMYFCTSIANRLGVKLLENQKLRLCKFIKSCVICSLNMEHTNSFIKYTLPFAQKLNLTESQFDYLKKQIKNLIDTHNENTGANLKYENSIFEHLLLVISKKKKLTDEFKDPNQENLDNRNRNVNAQLNNNSNNRNASQSHQKEFEQRRESEKDNSFNPLEKRKKHAETNRREKPFQVKREMNHEEEEHTRNKKARLSHMDEFYKENEAFSSTESFINQNESDIENVEEQDIINDHHKRKDDIETNKYKRMNETTQNSFLDTDNRSDRFVTSSNKKSLVSPQPIRTEKATVLRFIKERQNANFNLNQRRKTSTQSSDEESNQMRNTQSMLGEINELKNKNYRKNLDSFGRSDHQDDPFNFDSSPLISEQRDQMSFAAGLDHNEDDDLSSDLQAGISPLKMNKSKNKERKKKEYKESRNDSLSPVSYADDLMNF